MSKSDTNINSLVRKAEAALQSLGDCGDAPSIDQVLAEIQSAMSDSADAGKILGPLVGKLRAAQSSSAASPFNWISVLRGSLAIGHRPKIRLIRNMRNLGATHVLTLLSQAEGAESIGTEVRRADLDWMWLPLTSGDPPSGDRSTEITQTFVELHKALDNHARIYVHCSAGIHRTGMISYAFLRSADFSAKDALTTLSRLRQETADGVGDERKQWGEQFASRRDISQR